MDLQLRGKRALVTGGSRGIGFGIANLLAEEGCNLALCSRSVDSLESARAALLKTNPGIAVDLYPADLGSPESTAGLAAACGPVDILINNAGAIPQAPIEEMDDAQWRAAWELKVFGYINLTRAVYTGMKARKSGVVLNIIGIAGERPLPSYLAGSMANAALMAMTRGLGIDGMSHGVRVVGLNPGNTETDRQVVRWKARAQKKFGDENRWRELVAGFPQGRLGTVDEVAAMAVFLCSPRSNYTNATVVTVDGGWTAAR
ncbi:SDR family oxidoreductase [Pigmentiphaga soli]|uniref:SDR family oxidoreductase n=1 Tax=Pigmentiphaga soli TaxID=1007095 RepID=A0ABP8HLU8_9BURK